MHLQKFLIITCLFTTALQHSGGHFTDAFPFPFGGQNQNSSRQLRGILTRDNSHVITITEEDRERNFTVFDPASEGDAKRPLVLAYHGVLSDSETMRQLTQFDKEAKDRGWVAAYPQGEWKFTAKFTSWNGAGCCSQGMDDIAFTKDMIDYMVRHFNVDEDKVYVVGVSNGGFMVYRLICEMGNRENGKSWIAAAGVHSALLGAWDNDFSTCSISKETPLVHFHGLADPVVNITGKSQGVEVFGVPFKPVTNAEWKSVNASIDYVAEEICGSSDITNTTNPTESTTCHKLCHGKVEICLVTDLAHHWSGCSGLKPNGEPLDMYDPNHATNVDATEYFANFFARHSIDIIEKKESTLAEQ